jgi:hypothetical protein
MCSEGCEAMVAEAGAGDLQFAGFGQATNDAGEL